MAYFGEPTYTELDGTGIWSGWSGIAPAGKTLSCTASAGSFGAGSVYNQLSYTLDGSTWTNWFSASGSLASANYSVSIPAGTNLANVQVQASSYASASQGSNRTSCRGSLQLSNLKIA
jgi:hypothetical protein